MDHVALQKSLPRGRRRNYMMTSKTPNQTTSHTHHAIPLAIMASPIVEESLSSAFHSVLAAFRPFAGYPPLTLTTGPPLATY
jgi:hypothetical protein